MFLWDCSLSENDEKTFMYRRLSVIKLLAPYKMSFYTWTTSYHLRTFPGKWTVQKSISIHIRVYWEASTLKEREMGLQVLLSTPRFSHYTMSAASPSTGPTHCSAHLSAIHRLCRSHKLSACRADRTQGETQKEGQQAGSLNILWFWEIHCPQISARWLTTCSASVTSQLNSVGVWSI